MLDYIQKAREELFPRGGFNDTTRTGAIRIHATTLEALDKAEAERDALRKAGKALIDRVHDFMAGALRVSGTHEYRALPSSSPNPICWWPFWTTSWQAQAH